MWERSIGRVQREALGSYLKQRRGQIPSRTTSLGDVQRLPPRVGRRVTQEEMAEVVGTSRAWYSMIECGIAPSVSPRLLERIAIALGLREDERITLLLLAFPELVSRSAN